MPRRTHGKFVPLVELTGEISMDGDMQKFVALPTLGDAFLLQRNGVNILVDSGWKKDKLANLLSNYVPDLECVHIAVCTHADGDHAGGFTTLLDDWQPLRKGGRAPIGQFWLPGAWSGVVPDLMLKAREFADTLIEEMESLSGQHHDVHSGSAIDAALGINQVVLDRRDETFTGEDIDEEDFDPFDELEDAIGALEDMPEPQWMGELRNLAGDILIQETEGFRAMQSARRRVSYRVKRGYISETVGRYWLGLIDTADIIRQITLSAIKYQVKIRWFDHREFERTGRPIGGIHGLLVPINAVEQRQPPSGLQFSYLLRLSVKNEQCLSFYSPGHYWQSGVLFCGDSPMGYGNDYSIPFKLPRRYRHQTVIATAPHHGSESNAVAYGHIRCWIEPEWTYWVRNGGRKNHPGSWYRSIPSQYWVPAQRNVEKGCGNLTRMESHNHSNWASVQLLVASDFRYLRISIVLGFK